MKTTNKYDDIICLPHPVSDRHARMPNRDRAAQFSPFAALTGFDEEICEAARLTDAMAELTESRKGEINAVLQHLLERIDTCPEISVTWFRPDQRKTGGAYLTTLGKLKRIDDYTHALLLADGTSISLASILNIQEID